MDRGIRPKPERAVYLIPLPHPHPHHKHQTCLKSLGVWWDMFYTKGKILVLVLIVYYGLFHSLEKAKVARVYQLLLNDFLTTKTTFYSYTIE